MIAAILGLMSFVTMETPKPVNKCSVDVKYWNINFASSNGGTERNAEL